MSGARETWSVHEPAVTLRWDWETYTPQCELCKWEGKPRDDHAAGVAACRSHAASRRHRVAKNAAARR